MPTKNVDAVFGLKDMFSPKMQKIIKSMEKGGRQLRDMSWKIRKAGKEIKAAGDTMTKALTLPIVAAGAFSVNAYKEVKAGTDNIIKATGATGNQLEEFKNIMTDVAGGVANSFDNIGSTLGEVNTRFGYTGDALKNATSDFEKFAKVTGLEGSESVRLVSRAMGDAGIAADQYSKVLDQLTVAGQASGIAVDQLAENLTKYGAPMRALGLDTEESIALFSSWEKAGVNTEIAFSGMKKAISNWGKEGKNAGEEFKKTLDAIASAPDIANATSLAIEAFGAKAGPDLADAIKNGRFEYSEMLNLIQNSSGSVESAYNDMLGPVEKMQMVMNKIKGPASELGSAIIDTLMPTFDKLAAALTKVTEWFGNLSDGQKTAVVRVAMVVAAIGPLLSIIGRLTIGFGKNLSMYASWLRAFKGAKTEAFGIAGVFGKLGAVMQGNFSGALAGLKGGATKIISLFTAVPLPVLAVVAVIGVLVAAFKHLWDTNEKFRTAILAIWNKIKTTFGDFIQQMRDRIQESGLAEKFAEIAGTVKKLWNSFCNFLGPVFIAAFNLISEVLSVVLNTLIGLFDVFAGIFTGDWKKVWSGLKTIFTGVWNAMKNVFNVFITAFKQKFPGIASVASTVINGIRTLINGIKTTLNGIITFITGVFTGNWSKAWQGVKSIFAGIFTGLGGLIKTPINGVINIVNGVIDRINSIKIDVPDWVPGLGGKNFSVNVSKIPNLATGTDYWKGGIVQVSERGGEIIDLPRGSRVYPHDQSVEMARNQGQTVVEVKIGSLADTMIVREEADIEKIAQTFAAEIKKVLVNRGEVAFS